jgi:hypothetical protein
LARRHFAIPTFVGMTILVGMTIFVGMTEAGHCLRRYSFKPA